MCSQVSCPVTVQLSGSTTVALARSHTVCLQGTFLEVGLIARSECVWAGTREELLRAPHYGSGSHSSTLCET